MFAVSQNYTDRDFDSIRARVFSGLKSAFPFWTDLQVADIGTALVESFAFVGDIAMFNLDWAAREAKWGSATQMRSILRLAPQIAYRPKGYSAASTTETISAASLDASVTILAGSIIQTKGQTPSSFQTLESVSLSPGNLSVDVDVENSTSVSDTFAATSDPNQVFVLSRTPFLDGSETVVTGQGTWTRVDNFLDSRAADLHYVLTVDANDRAKATAGDGSMGALPIGSVGIAYKTWGGVTSPVPAGMLTELQGSFYDALGTKVSLSATNALATVGGDPRETVASIKVKAPSSIRAGDRTVSRPDFETRGRASAGVGRCLMLTRNEDPTVDPNTGMLWVVPTGMGFLTSPIRAAITAQFALYPYAPSFVLDLMDPHYLDVAVFARIYLQGTAKASAVKAAVLANLNAWFALTTLDSQGNVIDNPTSNFGYYTQDAGGVPVGSLSYSDLFNVVRDTAGVRKVGGAPEDFLLTSAITTVSGSTAVQTNAHADLVITNRQYPRFPTLVLGASSLILENGDTGAAL